MLLDYFSKKAALLEFLYIVAKVFIWLVCIETTTKKMADVSLDDIIHQRKIRFGKQQGVKWGTHNVFHYSFESKLE